MKKNQAVRIPIKASARVHYDRRPMVATIEPVAGDESGCQETETIILQPRGTWAEGIKDDRAHHVLAAGCAPRAREHGWEQSRGAGKPRPLRPSF